VGHLPARQHHSAAARVVRAERYRSALTSALGPSTAKRPNSADSRFLRVLSCHEFIVAAGHEFYDAVNADPAMAVVDAECEEMCYFFAHLHD
jgi:hypothetical protein